MTRNDVPSGGRPPRTGRLVLAALLFAAVAVLAAVTDPEVANVPVPRIELDDPGTPSESYPSTSYAPMETEERSGFAGLIGLVLLVLLFGSMLALIGTVLWRGLRNRVSLRPMARFAEDDAEAELRRTAEVKAAVEAGLEELAATGSDPRSAVIACWLRLERAAAAAGTQRAPSDTPGDLVARMLAGHDVSAPVLDRLAAVYRQARYAPHEVGEQMRDEAQAALRQVHTELSRPRSAVPAQAVPGAES